MVRFLSIAPNYPLPAKLYRIHNKLTQNKPMAQSQNRHQKRVLKQLFKSSQQTKIANRYISKLEEYKKLSFEELDQFAKDVYNKTIKLSKTDKEALYEVYRPQLMQKAQKEFAAKMANNIPKFTSEYNTEEEALEKANHEEIVKIQNKYFTVYNGPEHDSLEEINEYK